MIRGFGEWHFELNDLMTKRTAIGRKGMCLEIMIMISWTHSLSDQRLNV